MDAAGIKNYRLEKDECHVYGNTIDVISGDLELGSGAYGPHKLDPPGELLTHGLELVSGLSGWLSP
jgi:hypothetical protein